MRLASLLWAIALLALAGPVMAAPHALKGVALVIGETDYVRLPQLANPDRDARDMDHMLDDLGFEVTRALDVRSEQLWARIDSFLEDAGGADVALVYYSGHGIEAGGKNYIMGVDADISDASAASATLIPFDAVLDRLQKTVPITIVLLDACRTNPFIGQDTLVLGGDTAPISIGQQGLEVVRGPTQLGKGKSGSLGVVVGFSASPGQSALDGPAGENSPYTSALLQHLSAAGYSFGDIMTMVTQEVYVDTGARQLPWTNSSLTKVLYFGRESDPAKGDDAAILSDRRKLLLDIADLPEQSKAFVEAVAVQEDLKLSDLFAMLDIINKAPAAGGDRPSLFEVAKRVREVLDDPILSGAPSDPELARLDSLANKALAAGAFKRAFDYRQQEAKRAAEIEKSLDSRQASVDAAKAKLDADQQAIEAQRRELAGVYARVAEAAMYTLNPKAESEAYKSAAKQSDLFDKTISIRLRLRSANVLADQAEEKMDLRTGLTAIALYQDILKEVQSGTTIWADTQLRMGETMWDTANRQLDRDLDQSAADAARAALTVFKQGDNFRRWSRSMRLLAKSLQNVGKTEQTLSTLAAVVAATPRAKYPLDFAEGEEALGHLYYDIGFWDHEADTALLGKAVEAYDLAASAYARYARGGNIYTRISKAKTQAELAQRTGDMALMRRAAEEGAVTLSEAEKGSSNWAYTAMILAQVQVTAGIALDDEKLVKAGIATFAAAEKSIITAKSAAYDWGAGKLYEGDAFRFLGLKEPRNPKLLKAAVAAYASGIETLTDIGNVNDFVRLAHNKMVRLQALIGAKVRTADRAIAAIPAPAVMDFAAAKLTIARISQGQDAETFSVTISSAAVGEKPWEFTVVLEAGYDQFMEDTSAPSFEPQRGVSYLKVIIDTASLSDAASRNASYSDCGSNEGSGSRINFYYGRQGYLNSCVLSKMAPADAAVWQTVLTDLPELIRSSAGAGDPGAQRIDPLFLMKPLRD